MGVTTFCSVLSARYFFSFTLCLLGKCLLPTFFFLLHPRNQVAFLILPVSWLVVEFEIGWAIYSFLTRSYSNTSSSLFPGQFVTFNTTRSYASRDCISAPNSVFPMGRHAMSRPKSAYRLAYPGLRHISRPRRFLDTYRCLEGGQSEGFRLLFIAGAHSRKSGRLVKGDHEWKTGGREAATRRPE